MSNSNGTKIIDGKAYEFRGWFVTKTAAQKYAQKKRRGGSLARIFKIDMPMKVEGYGKKQYQVWELPAGKKGIRK